ncbi:hypothetical protein FB451DRAFT_1404309 [Mycena latifolia]|nr:hypothetical protein FB451DRAFT_1404309 [Mycena latifolia]
MTSRSKQATICLQLHNLAACPPFSRLLRCTVAPPRYAPLPPISKPERNSRLTVRRRPFATVAATRHVTRPVSPRERPTDSASSPQLTDYASSLPRPYNPPPPSRPALPPAPALPPRSRRPRLACGSESATSAAIPNREHRTCPFLPIDPYDLPGIPSCLGASCSNRAEWNTTKHAYRDRRCA